MTSFEQQEADVLHLINEIRKDPSFYVPVLEAHLKNFKGNQYKVPGTHVNVITEEGPAAVKEAIEALLNAEPCKQLLKSPGLTQAAWDHATDLGQTGRASHEGSDGSRMSDRFDRYGKWDLTIAENIVFDDSVPQDIVLGMLVDDGNKSRGHRKNILNPQFSFCGLSISEHTKFKYVTVVNFVASYKEDSEALQRRLAARNNQQTQGPNQEVFVRKTIAVQDDKSAANIRITEQVAKDLPNMSVSKSQQSEKKVIEETPKISFGQPQSQIETPKNSIGVSGDRSDSYTEYVFKTSGKNIRDTTSGSRMPGRSGYVEYDPDNDPDWPEGAVNVRVYTHIKPVGQLREFQTSKIYYFADGEDEIVQHIYREPIEL